MWVQMMRIGYMRMFMTHGFMPVPMAVALARLPRHHGIVGVLGVAIVVRMGMLVVQRFMLMAVAV